MVHGLTNIRYENGKKIKLTLQQTIEKLHKAGDYETLFMKDMDRYHNMQTIEGLPLKKQRKVAEETTNVLLGTIAPIFEKLGIHEKFEVEEEMFNLTHEVLAKKKEKGKVKLIKRIERKKRKKSEL